jgi:uncharacterized protein (DUF1684 family)
LKTGANTAGSAKQNDIVLPASTPAALGRFILRETSVRFEPAPGTRVLLRDKPVSATIDLRDDRNREVDELVVGNVRLVVHVSGDKRSIRVRDPNGPLAKGFKGFTWFPIQDQYRVVGRFLKDAQPQRLKVLNTYGDIDELTPRALSSSVFRDRSCGCDRSRRGRNVFTSCSRMRRAEGDVRRRAVLYADLLDDGTTVLDFNQAYNPPCAFNPYTTCRSASREQPRSQDPRRGEGLSGEAAPGPRSGESRQTAVPSRASPASAS